MELMMQGRLEDKKKRSEKVSEMNINSSQPQEESAKELFGNKKFKLVA
jgi:hypothetical protein